MPAEELSSSPWHAGELEIQRHAGVLEQMDPVGRKVLRTFMLDQHREFYPVLPFIVIGAVDGDGTPWATIRSGQPGFLQTPDSHTLDIDAISDPNDPAEAGMKDGDPIGLVGVDLITRRRNRMNGTVIRSSSDRFSVAVGQSFGNCPRYIQHRQFSFVRDPATPQSSEVIVSDRLDAHQRGIIEAADSFFVASYVDLDGEGRQVDASHRGGRRGFVRVDADGGLTVPDFNGNLFFNTLGNFAVNPRAGLLFVDHETGDMLQIAGSVEIILDSPEIAAFEGAERLWRVMPEKVVLRKDALPLRWRFLEDGMSPSSLMTGNWREAASRLKVAAQAKTWRRFRVERAIEESSTIRSLHLSPVDGEALIKHLAGQHLPISITQGTDTIRRSYTLSSAPSDGFYRLSVKREGRASTLLHKMREGDEIEALSPAGAFTIDAMERSRPAVLLAAGIGITPLLSMLRHVVHTGDRTRYRRQVWLFRSSRTFAERAFDREIGELVARSEGTIREIKVLGAPDVDSDGLFDAIGRIDMTLLKAQLPFGDYDFYICGPSSFMQSMYDGLRTLNIADGRIHAEAFGPSGLKRDHAVHVSTKPGKPAASVPTPVVFTQSSNQAQWEPDGGSLLELAEQSGLSPPYGCRAGNCGDCRTKIVKGDVSYLSEPGYAVADGEALICCSVPAQGEEGLQLEL
ncbi:2Fe-2S iron-sulfur cluster binding domain-containing protein [Agrobacterium rubi]|uniref:Putative oxidoreductase n=1 Tax=Agrobacterium rubi TR3 = NBRC 13261 TaxID=1368415 RepID=A0A081D2Y1_9HYPH|nr:pyridoxamine 5'-phosphate oxidase family protein [Agrobacterium rubi]MBP1881488.1 ferredoxin-NADP reductase/predicted pyridoxine 5'-phosphate oxidase superfamily flavin-nucleotide-binding protein [Agrobacterium rubi]MCL6650806.1 FAD-binding oxidoreductase [Agrobacterium rubi]NTF09331.1 2Fe-2S iron-sulfur cluster binding domain-containing protein [Agrobacterium rubi]NTF22241.1 2Fe-2S iron-sulfur cluster binding domain-containing protein [Agrobacterium rubi]NTF29098.1 2Fe-2S iron-sulfur clust